MIAPIQRRSYDEDSPTELVIQSIEKAKAKLASLAVKGGDCWVIQNQQGDAWMGPSGTREIYVFSNQDLALNVVQGLKSNGFITERYTWDALVDKFSDSARYAVLDYRGGRPARYLRIPLWKDV